MPCSADTGNTSAMPRPKNSLVRPSRICESILLTARETGLPRRLSIRARSRSLPVISARPSTRKMMWSAVFKTNSAWRRICPGMYSWSCTTMPPVSISSKRRPSSTGKGILWAVLDSGIDGSHPHFDKHGNLRDLPAPLTHMDFMADPPARLALPADDYGHGTHVAGIIAGELEASSPTPPVAIVRERDQNGKIAYTADHTLGSVVAIAPECKLVSFKVLDQNGQGPISNVIAALDMIQEINGFGRQIVIHGVNLSVGYDFDAEWFACGQSPVCVEVNRLVKSGVCVVIAAGNTGRGFALTINDPGNAEEAITVGATHRDMPHTYGVSYFSSKGPTGDGRRKPDLLAPGERIVSCGAGPDLNTYKTKAGLDGSGGAYYIERSGTSQATPHVSGVIAGLLSVRAEFVGRPQEIKKLLMENAIDLGRDGAAQGRGLVDMLRTIQAI